MTQLLFVLADGVSGTSERGDSLSIMTLGVTLVAFVGVFAICAFLGQVAGTQTTAKTMSLAMLIFGAGALFMALGLAYGPFAFRPWGGVVAPLSFLFGIALSMREKGADGRATTFRPVAWDETIVPRGSVKTGAEERQTQDETFVPGIGGGGGTTPRKESQRRPN